MVNRTPMDAINSIRDNSFGLTRNNNSSRRVISPSVNDCHGSLACEDEAEKNKTTTSFKKTNDQNSTVLTKFEGFSESAVVAAKKNLETLPKNDCDITKTERRVLRSRLHPYKK